MKRIGFNLLALICALGLMSCNEKGKTAEQAHKMKDNQYEKAVDVERNRGEEREYNVRYVQKARFLIGDKSLNYGAYLRSLSFKEGDKLTMKTKTDSIRLVIFDWKTKKLTHSVAFNVQGPNGIGVMEEAYVCNYDSIFIQSNNPRSVYLVDIHRKVRRLYTIPYSTRYYSLDGWVGRQDEWLYSSLWPEMDIVNNVQNLRNSAVFARLNIRTGAFEVLPINYPTFFTKEIKDWDEQIHFIPRAVLNKQKSKLVYQFPAVDSLYVYDLNTRQITQYWVKSKYKTKEVSPKRVASAQEIANVTMRGTAYLNLIYDRYRDCYYRLTAHPIQEPIRSTSRLEIVMAMPMSIQILNNRYEILGEAMLPLKKYVLYNAFVNKEGLWVSTSNPNNPETDEDYIAFDLLKLVKK